MMLVARALERIGDKRPWTSANRSAFRGHRPVPRVSRTPPHPGTGATSLRLRASRWGLPLSGEVRASAAGWGGPTGSGMTSATPRLGGPPRRSRPPHPARARRRAARPAPSRALDHHPRRRGGGKVGGPQCGDRCRRGRCRCRAAGGPTVPIVKRTRQTVAGSEGNPNPRSTIQVRRIANARERTDHHCQPGAKVGASEDAEFPPPTCDGGGGHRRAAGRRARRRRPRAWPTGTQGRDPADCS